ncbi:hypothetical protein D3C72_1751300 [compost metagenome]
MKRHKFLQLLLKRKVDQQPADFADPSKQIDPALLALQQIICQIQQGSINFLEQLIAFAAAAAVPALCFF